MRRIVLKVGSAVLTQDGELALDRLKNLVNFIADLKSKNNEIILVSSGAVAAGYTLIQLDQTVVSKKQTLAAVGQSFLMATYRRKFNKYNIVCSQVLLEASIFKDKIRLNHAKNAINEMKPLKQNQPDFGIIQQTRKATLAILRAKKKLGLKTQFSRTLMIM